MTRVPDPGVSIAFRARANGSGLAAGLELIYGNAPPYGAVLEIRDAWPLRYTPAPLDRELIAAPGELFDGMRLRCSRVRLLRQTGFVRRGPERAKGG